MEVVVERCAFLDVHRDTVVACARTPDRAGGRREEVASFGTTTSQLLKLADWLSERKVSLVGCARRSFRLSRSGRCGT